MTGTLRLLSLVAALLLGLLLWDRFGGEGPAPTPPPPTAAPAVPETAVAPLLPEALRQFPLFQPSRQAMVAPSPDALPEIAPTTVTAPPAAPPTPVLLGVVTAPAPGGALIGLSEGGETVFLRPGQKHEDWTLLRVERDRAHLATPGGEITLLLPSAQELAAP